MLFRSPKGPAGVAGLRGLTMDKHGYYLGDVLLAINEQEINSYDDIFNTLDKYKTGDTLDVTYLRDGKKLKIKVTLK